MIGLRPEIESRMVHSSFFSRVVHSVLFQARPFDTLHRTEYVYEGS